MASRAKRKRQRRIWNAVVRAEVQKKCGRCKATSAVKEKTGGYACAKCGYAIHVKSTEQPVVQRVSMQPGTQEVLL